MNEREDNLLADATADAAERAYLDQIAEIVAGLSIVEIQRALDRGDLDAVLALMSGLVGFLAMTEALRRGFLAAGAAELRDITPGQLARAAARSAILPGFVGVPAPAGTWQPPPAPPVAATRPPPVPPFNPRSATATASLAEIIDPLVRDIQEAQRNAVAAAYEAGTAMGRSTRQIALDIAGRVQEGGRRAGGVIGLSGYDTQVVYNARAQLNGTAAQKREYLARILRDRRFDRAVQKSIETGRPIPQATIDNAVGRYADRILLRRAQMLAQTAAKDAVSTGRTQAIRQLIEEGRISRAAIEKEWETRGDERVRNSHRAMDGQRQPFDQPFISPSGARLMHPGDTSLGAGWDETAGCRCFVRFKL